MGNYRLESQAKLDKNKSSPKIDGKKAKQEMHSRWSDSHDFMKRKKATNDSKVLYTQTRTSLNTCKKIRRDRDPVFSRVQLSSKDNERNKKVVNCLSERPVIESKQNQRNKNTRSKKKQTPKSRSDRMFFSFLDLRVKYELHGQESEGDKEIKRVWFRECETSYDCLKRSFIHLAKLTRAPLSFSLFLIFRFFCLVFPLSLYWKRGIREILDPVDTYEHSIQFHWPFASVSM